MKFLKKLKKKFNFKNLKKKFNFKKLKKKVDLKNIGKGAASSSKKKRRIIIISIVAVLLLAVGIGLVVVDTRPEWATRATMRRNKDYFASWKKLETVTIKNSVTAIGDETFRNCSKIKTLVIPETVVSIGEDAFKDCSSLTDITVAKSVKTIARGAFDGCVSLMLNQYDNGLYLKRGNNPYSILVRAASKGITSCVVHKDTEIICYGAFSGCRYLEALEVEAGNALYHSADNCIIQTPNKILSVGCKTSIIPSDGSVTSIGPNAFSNCQSLTNLVIPNTVKSIGWGAFQDCVALESISIPASVTTIENWSFYNCRNLKAIYYGGTEAQWKAITKVGSWKHSAGDFAIYIVVPTTK